jgi:formylglycine-generating enzyme required for sulfatase activity
LLRVPQFIAVTWLALVCAVAPAHAVEPLTAEQEHELKPKDTFRECADCPEMVVVPAGSFTMGSPGNYFTILGVSVGGEKDRFNSEGPQHVVTISKPFAVGKLHVTVDQFKAFVSETGYAASTKCNTDRRNRDEPDGFWSDPGFKQEGSHPVVCVSWDDANAYADWLAKMTGKPYRLLSEAEWEYAARGQTQPAGFWFGYPRFWFGNDEKDLCQYGNGNTKHICNDGYDRTSPAGHYEPNAFGLYDMAGNAWQWTADCWHENYNGAPTDGSARTAADCKSGRVVRGGSWDNPPVKLSFAAPPGNVWRRRTTSVGIGLDRLRAAARGGGTSVSDSSGFRVARSVSP